MQVYNLKLLKSYSGHAIVVSVFHYPNLFMFQDLIFMYCVACLEPFFAKYNYITIYYKWYIFFDKSVGLNDLIYPEILAV